KRLPSAFAAAVAALEAERQAHIEKLEQFDVALGRREHFVEQREEFFAAVVFALDFGEQSLIGPLAAPRRRRRGIIEQRAEREPRSLHLIVGNPGGERAALEAVDLLAQQCARAGWTRLAHRVAVPPNGSAGRVCAF